MGTAMKATEITIFTNNICFNTCNMPLRANSTYSKKITDAYGLNNILHHFYHSLGQRGRSPPVQTFLITPETLSAGQLILLKYKEYCIFVGMFD